MQKEQYSLIMAGALALWLNIEARAATPKFDFNGDGAADIAIGAPGAYVNTLRSAGTVTVIYGTGTGLQPNNGTQLWDLDRSDVPGVAHEGDYFGWALAAADFNGDGYTDLAIGVRSNNGAIFNYARAGSVVVLYGSSIGLIGTHTICGIPCAPQPQTFTMPSGQMSDFFGSSMVAARFDSDQYVDLAAGAPHSDVNGVVDAGAVLVLKGSASGLTTTGKQVFSLDSGLIGIPHTGDEFGDALAAGDFGKTAALDLAIGIPGRAALGGAVSIIYGGQFGLSPIAEPAPFEGGGNQFWTQNATAFPTAGNNDRFGASLAAANFGRDHFDDLAIGIPLKTIDGVTQCGAVTILYGGGTGLSNTYAQQWGYHNLPGAPRDFDFLGASLAAGNFGYNSYADLAIGVPNHPVDIQNDAGVVNVMFGSADGLTATNSINLYSPTALAQDKFGTQLSAAHFGSDSYADLAIGIPYYGDSGAVTIRNGSATGPHTTASTNAFWSADNSFPFAFPAGAFFGGAISR